MDIPSSETNLRTMENFDQHEESAKEKKKGSALKNLIGWVVYLSLLVGSIFGTPKALSYVLNTSYPMAAITSGSMWPALKKGDLVFIKGVRDEKEIAIGDIVVYQNPQGFTIHRIVEFRNEQVVTKGDANNAEDSPVRYEDIIGKTVEFRGKPFRIPMLGNISIVLNK